MREPAGFEKYRLYLPGTIKLIDAAHDLSEEAKEPYLPGNKV